MSAAANRLPSIVAMSDAERYAVAGVLLRLRDALVSRRPNAARFVNEILESLADEKERQSGEFRRLATGFAASLPGSSAKQRRDVLPRRRELVLSVASRPSATLQE